MRRDAPAEAASIREGKTRNLRLPGRATRASPCLTLSWRRLAGPCGCSQSRSPPSDGERRCCNLGIAHEVWPRLSSLSITSSIRFTAAGGDGPPCGYLLPSDRQPSISTAAVRNRDQLQGTACRPPFRHQPIRLSWLTRSKNVPGDIHHPYDRTRSTSAPEPRLIAPSARPEAQDVARRTRVPFCLAERQYRMLDEAVEHRRDAERPVPPMPR